MLREERRQGLPVRQLERSGSIEPRWFNAVQNDPSSEPRPYHPQARNVRSFIAIARIRIGIGVGIDIDIDIDNDNDIDIALLRTRKPTSTMSSSLLVLS